MWAKQMKPSRRVAGHELAKTPMEMEISQDPVCGMYVAQGPLQFTHSGRSFLFCGFPCLDRFRQDPEAYRGSLEEGGRPSADPRSKGPTVAGRGLR